MDGGFDGDGAVVLDDEVHPVAGLDAQPVADGLRNGGLALGGNQGTRHPYLYVDSLLVRIPCPAAPDRQTQSRRDRRPRRRGWRSDDRTSARRTQTSGTRR